MTRPGIEPRFPAPSVNTLPLGAFGSPSTTVGQLTTYIYIYMCVCVCVCVVCVCVCVYRYSYVFCNYFNTHIK